jgi:predicted TIM-barrel fold metal-dependent hydrolase
MIDEPKGITYRHDVGVHKILWESDYPHADTPWPHCQKEVGEILGDVPQDEVDAITHTNAEKLFRWQIADPSLAVLDPTA